MRTALLITLFIFSIIPARGSLPGSNFSRLLAGMDEPHADPIEHLNQLEKFYTQVSRHRIDHGLGVATMYLDKAYALGDSTYIAKGYHIRGVAYSRSGDYLNALKDNLSSLEITEQRGDTTAMCNSYNNLGIVFEKLQKGEQALGYFEKSLQISMLQNDMEGAAGVLNNMGNLHSNMGNIPRAIEALTQAREIWIAANDTMALAYNLGNMGNVYMKNSDYRAAERYFRQATEMFERSNDKQNLAYTYLNLGGARHKQGYFDDALQLYETGYKLAGSTHQAHLSALFLRSMAESYAALGLYQEAYSSEIRHSSLRDSLLNKEAYEQITFYQELYEAESREREIILLREDQDNKQLQLAEKNTSLQRVRFRATILLFSLVLTIMAAIILVSRNRQKRVEIIVAEKINSQREQIKAIIKTQEAERIRFARDLHDGLGQMLTALKINLSPKAGVTGEYQEEIPLIANTLIKEMHQEIRNISFNIMPQMLVQKGLLPALHELARKINSLKKLEVAVNEHEVTHRFEPNVEIAIYRILQELLNNIIKYSNARNVDIQLVQHSNKLNIHVEDDGMGFDTTALKDSKGSGWKNICSRLKYIEGNIEIDSRPDRKNSTVIIDIPIARVPKGNEK